MITPLGSIIWQVFDLNGKSIALREPRVHCTTICKKKNEAVSTKTNSPKAMFNQMQPTEAERRENGENGLTRYFMNCLLYIEHEISGVI